MLLLIMQAGFIIWVAGATQQSADEVRRANLLGEDFQAAKYAVGQEESLERKYRLQPSPDIRQAHHQAGLALLSDLALANRLGDAHDRAVIADVSREHVEYLAATSTMFAAVDGNDVGLVDTIDINQVDPVFVQIETAVDHEATEHAIDAHQSLDNLYQIESRLLRTAPFVVSIGLFLVVLLWLTLEASRRARDAKSQFLARMSHELRTPLNAILGFSQMVLWPGAEPLSDKQRRQITNIDVGGRQLLSLINELLDLSKVEAGMMQFVIEDFRLDPVLTAVATQVSTLASDGGITLSVADEDDRLIVRGDRERLRQVLLNGLSNAIKYTPRGGHVRISAIAAAGRVVTEIIDDGRGMRKDEIATAFMEYGQVASAGTVSRQGTGLGIPLSKALAEAMDGTLHLFSKPGVGTTFRVALPAGVTLFVDLEAPGERQLLTRLDRVTDGIDRTAGSPL